MSIFERAKARWREWRARKEKDSDITVAAVGNARNVNLFITNWQWTGSNIKTPQAGVDLEIHWIDGDSNPREWSGVATFPNDLQLVPVAWVKEAIEELLVRVARHQLGID